MKRLRNRKSILIHSFSRRSESQSDEEKRSCLICLILPNLSTTNTCSKHFYLLKRRTMILQPTVKIFFLIFKAKTFVSNFRIRATKKNSFYLRNRTNLCESKEENSRRKISFSFSESALSENEEKNIEDQQRSQVCPSNRAFIDFSPKIYLKRIDMNEIRRNFESENQ